MSDPNPPRRSGRAANKNAAMKRELDTPYIQPKTNSKKRTITSTGPNKRPKIVETPVTNSIVPLGDYVSSLTLRNNRDNPG